ncbi:cell division protein FtsX [Desulfuromusa kysingii]|uniref:Cell division protein FtsX n=1 Tax=Desulfuromusa kysingii TaxID=37625 RepID=A0A1H3YPJ2_9BACT|nr:permease-like cell division protein FtsX [Desulfuromusa kysingii]SEA13466.1 cell division protein FtsX [Desulfuromusa kysingii]
MISGHYRVELSICGCLRLKLLETKLVELEAPAVLDKIRYFIMRALRNMRQWPLLCAASILTMAVALATVATFFLVVVNTEQLALRWTKEIQVIAYLQKAPDQQSLAGLTKKLKDIPEVETVQYVSQADAMKRFKKHLGEDASLLEGVNADLLPASFELGLQAQYRNQAGIASVIEQLENYLDVDDLRYGQQWLEKFNKFAQSLRFIGILLGGFLLFAALFIVSNTIKLTLYARRDELEIMALVGATMRFIQIPFMLEGAIQGVLGGVLSLAFLAISFVFILSPSLNSFWLTPTDFNLQFLSMNQQIIMVFSGVVLGVLGSLSSLRRFVRF